MKRIFALLLALAIVLSLAACGGGTTETMTKEELLAVAEEVDFLTIIDEAKENKARAIQNYVGKIGILSGYVSAIDTDYCTLTVRANGGDCLYAYLSVDELVLLEKDNCINVVGKITDIAGVTGTPNTYITLENAYIAGLEFEISGTLTVKTTWLEYYDANGNLIYSSGSRDEWIHYLTDDVGNTYKLLADDVETKEGELSILGNTYKNGDTLTVVGTQFYVQEAGLVTYFIDVKSVS